MSLRRQIYVQMPIRDLNAVPSELVPETIATMTQQGIEALLEEFEGLKVHGYEIDWNTLHFRVGQPPAKDLPDVWRWMVTAVKR